VVWASNSGPEKTRTESAVAAMRRTAIFETPPAAGVDALILRDDGVALDAN
jgi:hypothetical protein